MTKIKNDDFECEHESPVTSRQFARRVVFVKDISTVNTVFNASRDKQNIATQQGNNTNNILNSTAFMNATC